MSAILEGAVVESKAPPDNFSQQFGVLKRREVEARILAPLIQAFAKEFGREKVEKLLSETIVELAHAQGADLAEDLGTTVDSFAESLRIWQMDDAMEIEVIEKSETRFDFDVKRCRYAELYRELGIQELGALLSCNRDFALIEGFNPSAKLDRKKTIMAGDSCCTFRYTFPSKEQS
ncbi:MAG: L-2-amino-thiazoline-4-carboxylic acid hydrolase [Albidovulum sp.]|nr:L-2-amino-thiazoline-4-carboxylic acid hydrolase [Albidovulum sp.]MDE0530326.1 L-2-amino-thiazoline-4-carboxylic acid hydrolase [Albidovulum sp.]